VGSAPRRSAFLKEACGDDGAVEIQKSKRWENPGGRAAPERRGRYRAPSGKKLGIRTKKSNSSWDPGLIAKGAFRGGGFHGIT